MGLAIGNGVGLTVGAGSGGLRHVIVSVTKAGALAKVATATAHGLATHTSITVSGTGTYDGVWSITVVDATQFTLDSSAWSGNTTGGRWV